MNRNAPMYAEAENQVKISHFTRKGYDIRGVIHVGVNDGYEMPRYLAMGIENVIGVDPLASVHDVGEGLGIPTYQCALGNELKRASLTVTKDPGGSSLLFPTFHEPVKSMQVIVLTFFDLVEIAGIDLSKFDCLVLDVQGYELEVLKGMGHLLLGFKFLNIECSMNVDHGYEGAPAAEEIIDYVAEFGFRQDSPICEHDDIMFLKEGL